MPAIAAPLILKTTLRHLGFVDNLDFMLFNCPPGLEVAIAYLQTLKLQYGYSKSQYMNSCLTYKTVRKATGTSITKYEQIKKKNKETQKHN